jgi:2-oxoglutarate dehydrogenase E1 component
LWQGVLDASRTPGGLENGRNGVGRSIRGGGLIRYAGRDISASPATGFKKQHKYEEHMLVSEALLGGELRKPVRVEQDVPIFF